MHATLPLMQGTDFPAIRRSSLTTLQVNLGCKCNQSCVHCHAHAGCDGRCARGARVGLNGTEARACGVDYEVTTYSLDDLDRAIADEHARGFVKVLTHRGKDRILGATIVGSHAADLIIERYHAWMLA